MPGTGTAERTTEGRVWMKGRQAADYAGTTEQTLAQYRYRGEGPRFYKRGRTVIYDRADLDAWITGEDQ